jgi:SAM-dependent methyltransferase
MQDKDFEDLYALEQTLWWFQGMKSITGALMRPVWADKPSPVVLDAGCGTGDMVQWLQGHGSDVTGLDLSPTALRFCRRRGLEKLVQGSITELPFEDARFDVVTSFDVLAQLSEESDAAKALAELYRVLRPGGWAFVRAAAYPWMRSAHDVSLDSRLRFTRRRLGTLAQGAGFVVRRSGYANMFLFPMAMLHRLVLQPLGITPRRSDVRPLPGGLAGVDRIFRFLMVAESKFIGRGLSLPFGLSVVLLLRKPA